MKNSLMKLTLCLAFFSGQLWCSGQEPPDRRYPNPPGQNKRADMPGTRTAERRRAQDGYLAKKLGLTDEQREKFRAHNVKLHEELAGLHEQREQAKAEYKKIMEQDAPDEQAALTAVEELYKINADIVKLRVRAKHAINEIFTPEQRAQLDQLRKQAIERQNNRREFNREPGDKPSPRRRPPPDAIDIDE